MNKAPPLRASDVYESPQAGKKKVASSEAYMRIMCDRKTVINLYIYLVLLCGITVIFLPCACVCFFFNKIVNLYCKCINCP